MLLRREVAHGVEILAARGAVGDADVPELSSAIAAAAARSPRTVLLDLTETTDVSGPALQAIRAARQLAPGWPHPSLQVAGASAEITEALRDCLPVHLRREDGFDHADDRRSAPRHTIELDTDARSPARARAAAAGLVADLHLEPLGDDVALVVSELVTNAVCHAEPPLQLEIQAGDERVTVAVVDGSPEQPVGRDAAEDAESGRGMSLVERIAAETGVRPNPPGKTVWASLDRP